MNRLNPLIILMCIVLNINGQGAIGRQLFSLMPDEQEFKTQPRNDNASIFGFKIVDQEINASVHHKNLHLNQCGDGVSAAVFFPKDNLQALIQELDQESVWPLCLNLPGNRSLNASDANQTKQKITIQQYPIKSSQDIPAAFGDQTAFLRRESIMLRSARGFPDFGVFEIKGTDVNVWMSLHHLSDANQEQAGYYQVTLQKKDRETQTA